MTAADPLPDDISRHKALIAGQRAEMESQRLEIARQRAEIAGQQAEIVHLKFWIAKLRRHQFGRRSERADRFLDQLELQLEELYQKSLIIVH